MKRERADIVIRVMQRGEESAVIDLIVAVAQPMFAPQMTAEAFGRPLVAEGFFHDVEQSATVYGPPDGIFLVALDRETVIGTGAVRRWDDTTAELRRLWLRESYQRRGIGYRLTQSLLGFTRDRGYRAIRLTTDRQQVRAQAFYRQVGFQPLADPSAGEDDIVMIMTLAQDQVGEGH